MGKVYHFKAILLITLAILSITQETEARRKILKGRKTLTRYYYRGIAIPAWAIVTLVGFAEIIFGGLLYVIMKFTVLDKPIKPRYVPAPATP